MSQIFTFRRLTIPFDDGSETLKEWESNHEQTVPYILEWWGRLMIPHYYDTVIDPKENFTLSFRFLTLCDSSLLHSSITSLLPTFSSKESRRNYFEVLVVSLGLCTRMKFSI